MKKKKIINRKGFLLSIRLKKQRETLKEQDLKHLLTYLLELQLVQGLEQVQVEHLFQ